MDDKKCFDEPDDTLDDQGFTFVEVDRNFDFWDDDLFVLEDWVFTFVDNNGDFDFVEDEGTYF